MRNWGFLPTFKDYLKGDKETPEALIEKNFATRDFFFLKK